MFSRCRRTWACLSRPPSPVVLRALDPASRRLRGLDAPPAGDVSFVVRTHAELVGSRTDDLVVDHADGRPGLGIHGCEGVDYRHLGAPLPSCNVSPIRACVSRNGRGLAAVSVLTARTVARRPQRDRPQTMNPVPRAAQAPGGCPQRGGVRPLQRFLDPPITGQSADSGPRVRCRTNLYRLVGPPPAAGDDAEETAVSGAHAFTRLQHATSPPASSDGNCSG